MTSTDWNALIGAVTGVTGTALGIITAIDMLRKYRVKLRILPKVGWTERDGMVLSHVKAPLKDGPLLFRGQPPDLLVFEIANLSGFPVTISEIGLGRPDLKARRVLIVPDLSPGYTWPPVLESRRAVTVYQKIDRIVPRSPLSNSVYVKTECGVVRFGRSKVFDLFVERFETRNERVGSG